MAESGGTRHKKKKKDKKEKETDGAAPLDGGEASEMDALQLRVLDVAVRKPGCASTPVALLPGRELKRAGLVTGEPLLVRSCNGRFTVAVCEAGGRDGGVVLATSVAQSLQVQVDDIVTLTSEFEAFEAAEADVEVPVDLASVWPDLAGGAMQLSKYLSVVLDDRLVASGDVRTISLNGRPWSLRMLACRGLEDLKVAAAAETGDQQSSPVSCAGPWLITKRTRITISTPPSSAPDATAQPEDTSDGKGERNESLQPRGLARVGGLRGVIQELREAVQMPLEKPELYRKLGIGPPRGVLLYGPPGTGKTLLAKSLSEELRCPVELCASTDFVGGGIGETEGRIKAVFERCRKLAENRGTGALLFIDEIDAVCPKRDDASEAERRMVAAFLVALDGAKGTNDGIVVLGATNRPDSIDPALRRAGRLEREIEVGVPNVEERRQILDVHLSGLRNSLSLEDKATLARRCHGYVGADIKALCMAAARAAIRSGREAIDLEACLDAARLVPPSALKELLVEVPEVRWSDIGGYEKTKEALREAVEWPIRFSWAFQDMNMDPPRGVLLYGPPGCSKTMMAKAVATETEMNFVSIKGPELFSKYVGDSERAVRDVFRKARTAAPCVIFFDEIDAIGANREGEGAGGVAARVLAQLLAEMDGIGAAGAKRHVVVLAATNRPHVLDPALMRPGRFDRLVHVPLPDETARTAIFSGQLARMRVGAGVDCGTLAASTSWCSGAEVVMVCREAAMLAIRDVLETGKGNNGDDAAAPCAQVYHFDKAISIVKPRIDAETVRFYEDFESRMKHS